MSAIKITLVQLLRDWLDKKKFPIVSFTGGASLTFFGIMGICGEVWVGDFDVGVIYDDKIEFTCYYGAEGRRVMALYAADPDFFTHLENTLRSLMAKLKDNSDEGEGGEDRSGPHHAGLPRR